MPVGSFIARLICCASLFGVLEPVSYGSNAWLFCLHAMPEGCWMPWIQSCILCFSQRLKFVVSKAVHGALWPSGRLHIHMSCKAAKLPEGFGRLSSALTSASALGPPAFLLCISVFGQIIHLCPGESVREGSCARDPARKDLLPSLRVPHCGKCRGLHCCKLCKLQSLCSQGPDLPGGCSCCTLVFKAALKAVPSKTNSWAKAPPGFQPASSALQPSIQRPFSPGHRVVSFGKMQTHSPAM